MGVAARESRHRLARARPEILSLLDALEHGDAGRRILGRETRARTLSAIHAARAAVTPLQEALRALLANPDDPVAAARIEAAADALFEIAALLLSELSGQYSHPVELLQIDALTLDIAGRQSALSQEVARAACAAWPGPPTEAELATLAAAVETLHLGLTALQSGRSDLGLRPAPTPEIAAGLALMLADWPVVERLVAEIAAGRAGEVVLADLFARMTAKMHRMDGLVRLYVEHAKHLH